MKSKSYKPAKCCDHGECDLLDKKPDQPCWGQVTPESPDDDEDGWPIIGHLCQGHANAYDWNRDTSYIPEPNP